MKKSDLVKTGNGYSFSDADGNFVIEEINGSWVLSEDVNGEYFENLRAPSLEALLSYL